MDFGYGKYGLTTKIMDQPDYCCKISRRRMDLQQSSYRDYGNK